MNDDRHFEDARVSEVKVIIIIIIATTMFMVLSS